MRFPEPIVKDFYDQYDMVHAEPNTPCENPFLFTYQNELWFEICYPELSHKMSQSFFLLHIDVTTGNFYKLPWDDRPTSRDDIIAIVSASRRNGYDYHKHIDIAGKFWTPAELLYLNWMKGGWNRVGVYLFWPLIIPIQAWSCWHSYEIQGPPDIATSTKILCWVRFKGAEDSWVMRLSHMINVFLLKKHKQIKDHGDNDKLVNFSNFIELSIYYFKRELHPIRILLAAGLDKWNRVERDRASRGLSIKE